MENQNLTPNTEVKPERKKVIFSGIQPTSGAFTLGNYLGARLFSQRGARWTRPLIIVVLAIFFGKVCLSLL